ncbi:MAG: ECF transporter S component [Clostridiaceae bacterium]|nr:ECF transporter S component [Clostridiaceae bacterium]
MNNDLTQRPEKLEDQRTKNARMTRKLAVLGILTAMSALLMYLEVSLPLMPAFLKFDLSELPVMIGAFAYGPVSAIAIELVKNLIHLPNSSTAGVGQLANFAAGVLFAGSAGLVYRFIKTRKGAVLSLIIGTLVMTFGTSFLNYFVFLYLYGLWAGIPMETIVGMATEMNPKVADRETLILWAFVPFNLFKGAVISALTYIVYKPISMFIHKSPSVCQTKSDETEVDAAEISESDRQ